MKHRKIHQGFFPLPLSLGEGQGVRLLLLVLFFCSCGDSNDAPSGTSAQIAENIQVSVLPIEALSVPDTPATRTEKANTASLQVSYASTSTTRNISMTTDEKKVKTAYVVQFNGTSPTSTAVWVSGDVATQLNNTNTIPCYFTLTSGVKSRVYVVANPKSVPTLGTTLQAFETVAYTVSTLPGTGLPMVASQDVVLGGTFSTFQLKTPLARLTFTTNKGSLTLRGIPSSYSLLPATTGNNAVVRLSGVTYTNTTTLISGTTYYVPANLSGRGVLPSPVLRCSLFAPSNSMYVVISDNSTTYNVYLGNGSDSDFNVVSNVAYTVGANVGGTDEVDLRVNTPASITALDGSGTANCYIPPSANTWYSFKATVMGNGATTTGITPTVLIPVASDVLWETQNTKDIPTKGSVVKASYMIYGRILFRTGTNEGNAVIAARDASNNIIWSWHIWRGKEPAAIPLKSIGSLTADGEMKMMDRNLGGLSATIGSDLSYGLLYQWGRKDPFPGYAGFIFPDNVVIRTQPSGIHLFPTSERQYTVAQSIAQPTTFFGYNGDWCSTRNDNLWGTPLTGTATINGGNYNSNKGSKSIYDPCPVGWRVPPDYAWANATTDNCDWYSYGSDFKKITTLTSSYFWFPSYGRRNYDGLLDTFGSCGYYWTSSPSATNTSNGGNLYFFSVITPGSNCTRAFGNSVRCVKE